MKVEVYWNLHRKCWSVRHQGKVLTHLPKVTLYGVTWVVQPAGNRKVRAEGRKNVHAFARGTWGGSPEEYDWELVARRISYNPYREDSFVLADDRAQKVTQSRWGVLTPEGQAYINL